jgi:cytochrome c oxidase subunit 2
MKVEFYEKVFIALSLIMLLVFAVFLFVSVQQHGITLVGPTQTVDPATLTTQPPFDDPGVVETSEGKYLATVVTRMWLFQPETITVPVGAEVTFQFATPDVIHGVKIIDTDINVMVIPGQVSTVSQTFREPGEYLIVCHEYCGTGHQGMSGKVIVTEEGAVDEALPDDEEQSQPEAWLARQGGRS